MEDTQHQPLESTCILMLTQTCIYATKQDHTHTPKNYKEKGGWCMGQVLVLHVLSQAPTKRKS